jgi:peptidyl-prolyl cis-trans isomerase A (cyclophilin A)
MNIHLQASLSAIHLRQWLAMTGLVALTACGGGSGGSATTGNAPVVTAAVAADAKYSQTLTLTLSGSNLDQPLTLSSPTCKGFSRSSTAPWVSSDTTAYYQCTVSGVGVGQVAVKDGGSGAALSTVPFTVPMPQVTMTVTNNAGVAGSFVITLAPDKTPVTVDNFLAYVNSHFYDGTVFHRVSPGFVLQGGGYAAPLVDNTAPLKTTLAPIALEVNKGLGNTQWTVAMARTSDANSATSQFFINLVDNSTVLDPSALTAGYAVFGSVTTGTSTVTTITAAPCSAIALFLPAGDCTPMPNVVLTSAMQTQ